MNYIKDEDVIALKLRQADKITCKCNRCGDVFEKKYINAVNNIKKYGHIYCTKCMHFIQSEHIDWEKRNEKTKEVLIEKYGSVDDAYKKRNETTEKVWLEKYGVKHAWQAESVKDKIRATCLDKYGVANGGGSQEALEKIKSTCIERYGVDNVWKSDDVKSKIKDTVKEKYGVEYYTQSDDYQHKAHKRYTYNGIAFDSSWEIAFYIYCVEHSMSITRHTKGLPYKDADGKSHMYFPDFEVDGVLYEIKGGQFYTLGEFDGGIYKTPSYINKVQCIEENNVKVITDVSKYLEYVYGKYGKDYLRSFKNA